REDEGCLIVIEEDGVLIGMAAGYCDATWFADARVAGEYGIYIRPEQGRPLRRATPPRAGITTGVALGGVSVSMSPSAEQIRSNAIAELAASGVDVNSDTALRIDQQIVRDSEEDAFLALAGGTDRANRLDAEAQGYRNTGKQARTAGYVNAGSSLLRGASNSGRGWKQPASAGGY
ncbi:hypothetical protein SNK04_013981, partial [Fusarium graminearum]